MTSVTVTVRSGLALSVTPGRPGPVQDQKVPLRTSFCRRVRSGEVTPSLPAKLLVGSFIKERLDMFGG
jgi:hypothetical protein